MDKKDLQVGITKHIELLNKCLYDLRNGKGSIIAVNGEEGFGKTHLINSFAEEALLKYSDAKIVVERNVSPIGSFNIANIQPLLPFSRILEKILLGDTFDKSTATSKFLKNAGITFLASVPVIDTLFYAVKELGRDWRQYQKDKSSEKRNKSASTTTKDFFDTFCSIAAKKPLILMLDDFHWSDAQSVELLDIFSEDIRSVPIIIVISYRKSIVNTLASPLIGFITNKIDEKAGIHGINLIEFSKEDISKFGNFYIKNYKSNLTFETWVFENSFGVPGVVSEYIKYFKENNPFKSDGTLTENFSSVDYLPATIHSAFSKTIEKLSDDERNLLSICSAEGRECTALVVSNLMNKDVLTAIKKLRSLQQNYGIIRSIGAHTRYGVKTTIYEFTQAFYKKYFENLLEYEEKVALHGQIAALLKRKYEEAESEALKHEIAPYLAAHSIESGDEETAKSMLLVSAKAAKKFGNADIVKNVFDRFNELGVYGDNPETNPDIMAFNEILNDMDIAGKEVNLATNTSDNGSSSNIQAGSKAFKDFIAVRKIIVEYYHKKRFNDAVEYTLDYLNKNESDIRSSEKAQLLALVIKSCIESGQISLADNYATQALKLLDDNNDPVAECFIMNALAILRYYQNRFDDMTNYMKRAAQKAMSLSPELRLLTISNIAILTEKDDPVKSRRYFDSVRKLSASLNFEEFAEDVMS